MLHISAQALETPIIEGEDFIVISHVQVLIANIFPQHTPSQVFLQKMPLVSNQLMIYSPQILKSKLEVSTAKHYIYLSVI